MGCPSKIINLRKQVKPWKRYNLRLEEEWENLKEEPKLEDVIAEKVEEASVQELKRVKKEDKNEVMKIEDDDVTQERLRRRPSEGSWKILLGRRIRMMNFSR